MLTTISSSVIKDHWSQITVTNINNTEKTHNIVRSAKIWQRHEVSKRYWKNSVDRLACGRVATNLHFVKNKHTNKRPHGISEAQLGGTI